MVLTASAMCWLDRDFSRRLSRHKTNVRPSAGPRMNRDTRLTKEKMCSTRFTSTK
jgi:hypothetical protein